MSATRPLRISVVIPAHNSERELAQCLRALAQSSRAPEQIIVVDDASSDDTAGVAARAGARVVRLERNAGPATARNYGAFQSQGDVLFFLDADVAVALDAVQRVADAFGADGELAAMFGSYDGEPSAPGVVSQFRNLLHHYTHQRGRVEASTFWAGCGAIRRSVFEAMEGFDGGRFAAPSVEDIELGCRMHEAGHAIRLDKRLLCRHLKSWSLGNMLRTDLLGRAIPWSRLIAASGRTPNDLNLRRGQRLCVVLVFLALALLPLSVLWPLLGGVCLLSLLTVAWVNREFYALVRRQRGWWMALASLPLHAAYYVCCGLGHGYVMLTTPRLRRRPALDTPPQRQKV